MVNTFKKITLLFMSCLVFVIAACCHAKADGPPPHAIDTRNISNPIPHWEPLSRIGNRPYYYAKQRRYHVMHESHGYRERGVASWYGTRFHHRRTSNGEVYNMYSMTAAHKNLPLPTYVCVKNLENGREIIVRVNDRGPFHQDRIIDLSYVAAKKLGMLKKGTAYVEITAIDTQAQDADDVDQVIHPTDNFYGAETPHGQEIFIQVGAFRSRKHADYQAMQLSELVDSPVQTDTVATADGVFYRVQIGPLVDATESAQIQARLSEAGLEKTLPRVH
jgi:peptidoglycan lytic transglycosylase